ncbi:hypothetical protein EFL95_00945 [Nocardioides marmorisolisilvae]|uniref:Uncharacterized protein n=1 Tax=Nocardioides marmorisolisilvae TaxID=1542737 RepID=A0A3N0DZR5_9ACTN|nr:hypothetical protein EFL95_00945 [Nocardioides marmorisolisilvae]
MTDGDDEDLELIQPEDFLPRNPFPTDAQRLGFDRWSGGGIDFAASLNGRKRSHRYVAITLLVVFATPLVLTVLNLLR